MRQPRSTTQKLAELMLAFVVLLAIGAAGVFFFVRPAVIAAGTALVQMISLVFSAYLFALACLAIVLAIHLLLTFLTAPYKFLALMECFRVLSGL